MIKVFVVLGLEPNEISGVGGLTLCMYVVHSESHLMREHLVCASQLLNFLNGVRK